MALAKEATRDVAPAPTGPERTAGALAHVSAIFFPFIGPGVVWLTQRGRSRFASEHAVHAILDDLFAKVLLVVIGAISLTLTIMQVVRVYNEGFETLDWKAAIAKFLLFWLIFVGLGLWNTISSILHALRAFRGLPSTGISGRLARKWTKGSQDPA